MQHIHSKDIFYLLRETLKQYDRRPIVHGGKVAYYVYRMLEVKGGLEKYELADILFLATFHDIGAFRTEDIDAMVRYETKAASQHTLYGQLFLENLTLIGEYAQVLKYHHTSFADLPKDNQKVSELASYIYLAEMIDIFHDSLAEKFSLDIFKNQLGTKFSPMAFDLFSKANERYALFDRVESKEYKDETSEIMDYFILTNEEKENWLEFVMFTMGLKSDVAMRNNAYCLALCEVLGGFMRLDSANQQNLRYAAYLHDIGFMGFQTHWIENPDQLRRAQLEKLASHTLIMEKLLKDRIRREVIVIASAHHERVDGNGYPRRLTESRMALAQLILQFSDGVARRLAAQVEKDKLISYVETQTAAGEYSGVVTKTFIGKYDEIVSLVEMRVTELLSKYEELNEQYEKAI